MPLSQEEIDQLMIKRMAVKSAPLPLFEKFPPPRVIRESVEPVVPGIDLSLSPPLAGQDLEWDKLKSNMRSQNFVDSKKFDDMLRSLYQAYQAQKQLRAGRIPTVKIRGKF